MGVPTRNSSRCWANHHCRVVRWIIVEEYLREAIRGKKIARDPGGVNPRRRVFQSYRTRTLLAAPLVCMGDLTPPPEMEFQGCRSNIQMSTLLDDEDFKST